MYIGEVNAKCTSRVCGGLSGGWIEGAAVHIARGGGGGGEERIVYFRSARARAAWEMLGRALNLRGVDGIVA